METLAFPKYLLRSTYTHSAPGRRSLRSGCFVAGKIMEVSQALNCVSHAWTLSSMPCNLVKELGYEMTTSYFGCLL